MRRIIIFSLAAAVLWMGWWVIGSTTLERSMTQWLEDRRAQGWAADYSDLTVRGFPNRFDTRITDLRLADPATGIAWSAPFFEILQLSYRPNAAILVWPDAHLFSTPLQNIQLTTSQARGSLAVRPVPGLDLERATIILEDLDLTSTLGWRMQGSQARISAQRNAVDTPQYRFGLEFLGLTLPRELSARLNPTGLLPDAVQRLRLDTTIEFTAPLNRRVIEVERPQITIIELDDMSARWGDILFRAAGDLSVDAEGVPSGEISLRAEEWRKLLELSAATGALPSGVTSLLEGTLAMLAGLNGSPENLDTTLTFRSGRMFLGPLPLGPAPRIVLR